MNDLSIGDGNDRDEPIVIGRRGERTMRPFARELHRGRAPVAGCAGG